MKAYDMIDPLFQDAVNAIDSGNISLLQHLLEVHPQLVTHRQNNPTEGYFKFPYLLWFIAGNPVRNKKLPANIIEITDLLIKFVMQNDPESFQEQIDYTLGLVETGRIPRECNVQIGLIDLLIDNGAGPGNAQAALAHGNIEAAKHIIERSGQITLTAAVCLGRIDDVKRLLADASTDERQVALIAAAFYGKPDITLLLINSGVDVNAYIDQGFHTHATALHQAVQSGSLETVKLLLQAGANPDARDKAYNGTPLGWAKFMQGEESNENLKEKYKEIGQYLLAIQNKED